MQILNISQARRLALAAQGLGAPRPSGPVTTRHLQKVINTIGLLQIDSVNVLARSHYLPLFSRLGSYDRALLHRLAHQHPRRIVEYWAHEASYIPIVTHQLLQWRMNDWQSHAWRETRKLANEQPELIQAALDIVRQYGPLTATDIERKLEYTPAAKEQWGWNWSDAKLAVEALFWSGEIMAASRNGQFQRLYDVRERVLPKLKTSATRAAAGIALQVQSRNVHTYPLPARVGSETKPVSREAEAIRQLVAIAAKAYGIATLTCLRDYFRLSIAQTQQAVEELVAAGILEPVQVTGWDKPLYKHVNARIPRRMTARALLSPFDSLIFERERLQALFDFRYRLEIYTPQAKRQYGYYVLPFLLGERLVARVDLKADRKHRMLIVHGAYSEAHAPENTAFELAQELQEMAGWLELGEIRVEDRGDLSYRLRVILDESNHEI